MLRQNCEEEMNKDEDSASSPKGRKKEEEEEEEETGSNRLKIWETCLLYLCFLCLVRKTRGANTEYVIFVRVLVRKNREDFFAEGLLYSALLLVVECLCVGPICHVNSERKRKNMYDARASSLKKEIWRVENLHLLYNPELWFYIVLYI